MMKTSKLLLATVTLLLGLVGQALLAPQPAAADNLTVKFVCQDNSTKTTVTTNTTKHTATVKCASGSDIDYLPTEITDATKQATAHCPSGQHPGVAVSATNAPTKYVRFYCVKGGTTADSPTTRTKATPTVKVAQAPKPGSSKGGDAIGDTNDPALGSSLACTKDNCPLISKYINPIITLLSTMVAIVAVIAIVYGGIQVASSAGDPQKSAAGKNHIRNT